MTKQLYNPCTSRTKPDQTMARVDIRRPTYPRTIEDCLLSF